MLQLSSVSKEGVHVRMSTSFSPAHREVFKGRAHLTIQTGDCCLDTYPTAGDMRALAAELNAAADRVEAAASEG